MNFKVIKDQLQEFKGPVSINIKNKSLQVFCYININSSPQFLNSDPHSCIHLKAIRNAHDPQLISQFYWLVICIRIGQKDLKWCGEVDRLVPMLPKELTTGFIVHCMPNVVSLISSVPSQKSCHIVSRVVI